MITIAIYALSSGPDDRGRAQPSDSHIAATLPPYWGSIKRDIRKKRVFI